MSISRVFLLLLATSGYYIEPVSAQGFGDFKKSLEKAVKKEVFKERETRKNETSDESNTSKDQRDDSNSGEVKDASDGDSLTRNERLEYIKSAKKKFYDFSARNYYEKDHPTLQKNYDSLVSSEYYLCERTPSCDFIAHYGAAKEVVRLVDQKNNIREENLKAAEESRLANEALQEDFRETLENRREVVQDFSSRIHRWISDCFEEPCIGFWKGIEATYDSFIAYTDNEEKIYYKERNALSVRSADEVLRFKNESQQVIADIEKMEKEFEAIKQRYDLAVIEHQKQKEIEEQRRKEEIALEEKRQKEQQQEIIEREGLATDSERSTFRTRFTNQCVENGNPRMTCREVANCLSKEDYPNRVFKQLASPANIMAVTPPFADEVGINYTATFFTVQMGGTCD